MRVSSNVTSMNLSTPLPTPEEIDSAADALKAIENILNGDRSLDIGDATLSASLVGLITDVLSIVARGETVTFAPLSRRMTTQEAADFLNVSRPHLIKLIDQKLLPCEMTGTHRRLALKDLLVYKAKRSEGRKAALQEMQDIAEDL
ncbi:excisionase family DNA-binding protein [Roseovarius sp.]|uniref:excisionase family DNA-binding protein n=1 Tax=Roseovarius sp. TaxID=1486281 RepID=UPI00262F7F09|nr:excisionase family DNA-binding protein [Roseovarius sp.]MDM8164467.1 excisionase family DNA-binding protein [Roseovarius sp.]